MKTNLPVHLLSKSTFQRGLQCRKSLYMNKYSPELKTKTSEKLEEIFAVGTETGKLAQKLFPNGVDCGFEITANGQISVERTAEAIKNGAEVIYEAAFQFEEVLVIADILIKSGNKWKVFEVKSSTKVADYQINDTAVQYYVISKCGLKIEDISVVYINNQYIRKGEIDVTQLFCLESVLEPVLSLQDFVKGKIKEFKDVIKSKSIPDIDIGPHCTDPFECDFMEHCWKHIPDYSVFDLNRIGKKAFNYYKNGIIEIKDLPDSAELTVNQQIEINCYLKNISHIEKDRIKSFMDSIKYPLYFFDFESIQPAIPVFDDSRPYQQIVFQYSLYYKQDKDSEPEHFEFLGDGKTDPRRDLTEKLIKDTERDGTILVYNATFEITRLKELAELFPEHSEKLNNILLRISDLMIPFRDRSYYKPEMRSKYSLKKVLPAIAPEYAYSNLEIQDGGQAGMEYLKMAGLSDNNEAERIRQNLLNYCGRDTYGMIIILNELERICER